MPVPARFGAVLWLSFLLAAVATGIFFSAIDPEELRFCVTFPEVSRTGAYTIGFFLFWLLTAASGVLAVAFTYPPASESGTETPHVDD
ncbi:MAG: hypothetical protein IT492_24390 [Gammaproteobacteria bacterium]|nr:hypothetical protein [Gammaproteobacteria bacterium]